MIVTTIGLMLMVTLKINDSEETKARVNTVTSIVLLTTAWDESDNYSCC